MSLFAITFRIHNDATYQSRYESVVEAIKKLRTSTYWAEPTSFFLIEYAGTSTALTGAIDQASTFSPGKDLLLAINLSQNGYNAIGNVTDNDLHVLMKAR